MEETTFWSQNFTIENLAFLVVVFVLFPMAVAVVRIKFDDY